MDLKVIKRKYQNKRGNCRNRFDVLGNKIEFKLTFDEWYKIWLESGHLDDIGVGIGKYVMSRKNDIGHYEVGNVFIQSHIDNMKEGRFKHSTPHSQETKEKISKSKKGKFVITEETRKKLSKAIIEGWRKRKENVNLV